LLNSLLNNRQPAGDGDGGDLSRCRKGKGRKRKKALRGNGFEGTIAKARVLGSEFVTPIL
jgi:hypothetical protein